MFFSPAKVNLFLKVIRKRDDGYHDLSSLFQAVSLGDTLDISLAEKDCLTCDDPTLGCDESNLVLKAVNLFRSRTKLNFSVQIHLNKVIPKEAGLGGGSSNAATTLYALNQLLHQNISLETLQRWGAEIGSDVPFFFSSGRAYVTGRGENVASLEAYPLPDPLWLVKPHLCLSTAKVFAHLQIKKREEETGSLLASFRKQTPIFVNDLEEVAFKLLPELENLKKTLLSQGFKSVSLTGTGTGFICMGAQRPLLSSQMKIYPLSFLQREENQWYPFPHI